jgi:hypothetical protein
LTTGNINVVGDRTIIFRVVVSGCTSWSFRLREENEFRALKIAVLKKIFGPKREEVADPSGRAV